MTNSSHLSFAFVEQSQAQKEVTVNTALSKIDAVLNTGAKSRTTATPPGSPATGDVYIIASSPTGAWSGYAGKITYYDGSWKFITPNEGMTLWVNDEDVFCVYDGSDWQSRAQVAFTTLSGTSHTLDSSHTGKTLLFTNAGAITLTLPNSLPAGFQCRIIQTAAGQVTCSPASGASRRNRSSFTQTAGQWAVMNLEVITNSGGAAAEYVLSGDGA